MGLPTSREHTYGPNEPARSTDLNAIQDAIIAMKLRLGTVDTKLPVPQLNQGFTFDGDVSADPAGIIAGWKSTGAPYKMTFRISDWMSEGQVLQHLAFWVYGDGGAPTFTFTVYKHNWNTSTVSVVGTTTQACTNGGFDLKTLSDLNIAHHQLTSYVWLKVECSGADGKLLMILPEWA